MELPSAARLAEAKRATGWQQLKLDPQTRSVQLMQPGMQLDLGGIAAGYAIDEGLKILRRHGILSAMIDASGDVGASGAPPGTRGWRIAILPLDPHDKPTQFLYLANAAITTSGDAFQFVEIDGKRYSHIVDPKTGLGLTVPSAVTVVAPDCTSADSLATAASVLGPKAGITLIENHAGAACLFYRGGSASPEVFQSRGWKELPFTVDK
jgi:thiamine biosynthesis lipoprotein